tara:strand:+ start:128913 stop:129467 length:555 start_codon:yes stop_codon:yes gene_type:complete
MKLPIILIGPMATGKSTIAAELSNLLDIPRAPMDRIRWYYYFKNGFSLEKQDEIDNFTDVMAYWKPYEVIAVQQIVREFNEYIIDFGAGHSWFTDKEQLRTVSSALNDLPNIFLLLPSEDNEESLRICNERLAERKGTELDKEEIKANFDFINDESNYRLAKHIIYTKDKTVESTADEIHKLIQ